MRFALPGPLGVLRTGAVMSPVLQVDHVDAGFGTTPVLHGVSLSVDPGQAWVILGPNGSGKSTLARIVMGLLEPRAGGVTLGGSRLPLPPDQVARLAAWVPQHTDDDTGFTGLEVALMGCMARLGPWGLPSAGDTDLALEALRELDVAHLANRPLSEVSGGERRRVWLARALVQQPKLLVLDEPTAFLDVRHQVETLRALRRRVDQGLAVVAVLHDVNLVPYLASHVVLLKQGRVLAAGPVDEVLEVGHLSRLYDLPMQVAREADRAFVPCR